LKASTIDAVTELLVSADLQRISSHIYYRNRACVRGGNKCVYCANMASQLSDEEFQRLQVHIW